MTCHVINNNNNWDRKDKKEFESLIAGMLC